MPRHLFCEPLALPAIDFPRAYGFQSRSVSKMRNLLLLLFLGLLGFAQAISSTGNRLLVVLEDESEKVSFSQFWADLEGEHGSSKIIFFS